MFRKLVVVVALVACTSWAASASAATSIAGSLFFAGNGNNYYNPALGYVPAENGNAGGATVTIGSGTEFGFRDEANWNTADFSAGGLTVSDQMVSGGAVPWTQTFVADTAGFFSGLQLVSSSFQGFTYNVSGDTLTLNWGGGAGVATYDAVFSFGGAAVPEPATWAMMIVGFGAVGSMVRTSRRRNAFTAA